MEVKLKITGVDIAVRAVTEFMDWTKRHEWKDEVTEDYKKGFYDFGNGVINALQKMKGNEF